MIDIQEVELDDVVLHFLWNHYCGKSPSCDSLNTLDILTRFRQNIAALGASKRCWLEPPSHEILAFPPINVCNVWLRGSDP